MALTLTVPALEDRPLMTAETRPQKIEQFLATLSMDSPLDAALASYDRLYERSLVSEDRN